MLKGVIAMKTHVWPAYVKWVLLTEGTGVLAGWLIRDGVRLYQRAVLQPPLSPPGWVFPVVWAVLYALLGAGAARIALAPASPDRSRGLRLFWVQLGFHFCWPLLFFRLQLFGAALVWLALLWVLILQMTLAFRRTDPLAARLQLPYLLWTAFAGYLNAGVWLLN